MSRNISIFQAVSLSQLAALVQITVSDGFGEVIDKYVRFTFQIRFHILVKMLPEYKFGDEEIKKRFMKFYVEDRVFTDGLIPSLREKLSNLIEFIREIKVGFARYYNRRYNRRGYF